MSEGSNSIKLSTENNATTSRPSLPAYGRMSMEWSCEVNSTLNSLLNVATEYKLYTIFLAVPQLPQELRASISTLRALNYRVGGDPRNWLERLLIQGPDAYVHKDMRQMWEALARGDREIPIYDMKSPGLSSDPSGELSSYVKLRRGSSTTLTVEEVARDISHLSCAREEVTDLLHMADALQRSYFRNGDYSPELIGESRRFIAGRITSLRRSDPTEKARHWEFWKHNTVENARAFLDLAKEYNVEWAYAAHNLGGYLAEPYLPKLQALVNATPWNTTP